MITLDLNAHTGPTIRWAISPVLETLGWLRTTRDGATDPMYGAPSRTAAQLLSRPDVALVAALLPVDDGPTPDFLVPAPPTAPAARAARTQFQAVRESDHAQAAVDVRTAAGVRTLPDDVAAAAAAGDLSARASHGLEVFWRRGMPEVFDRAETALNAEIDRGTQLLGTGGIGAVLQAVHERLSWSDGPPTAPQDPAGSDADEAELLVIPTALYGPRLAMRLRGERPFVAYPVATTPPAAESIAGLRGLLGPTRAAILRQLSCARTTTELSEELQLATATVSYHVKVMQRAGLLERSRHRHNVFYELSATGRQLLATIP